MAHTVTPAALETAANVRAELARVNKTVTRMSRDLRWPLSSLNRRMNGETTFNIAELVRVAEYLEVPLTTLLPDTTLAAARMGESA